MISIYQFSQIEGIVFPFLFPLPYLWKLSPLIVCMVVKSGRTPFELEALLLFALPLLFTLAKFEEETTYKEYPLFFYTFKKPIVRLSKSLYHVKLFLNSQY